MRSLFQPEIFEREIIGSESLFKKEGEKEEENEKFITIIYTTM